MTSREREIAGLVAEGLTNQAIATKLHLSPRTVESHVARVYRKIGVSSRAALASKWFAATPSDETSPMAWAHGRATGGSSPE